MSIAEKSPQHHFAGNMTASAVLTLGEVLTMLDPITFITRNSDKLP
jgi:hypothetical protein